MQLDREAVNQIVAALASELDNTSAGVAHNKNLIEGTRTSINTLIEAMQIHTAALKATNDVLLSLIKRVRVLEEAQASKEKPPAV